MPLDYTDVELRIPNVEKARDAPRLRGPGRARRGARADDRVVPRAARRARVSDPIRLARPDLGDAELAAIAEVLDERPADDGAAGRARSSGGRRGGRDGGRRRGLVRHGRAPPRDARPRDRAGRRGDRARVHVPRDRERRRALRRPRGARRRRPGDVHRPAPSSSPAAVTPRTRAVLAVHLFGRPVDVGGAADRGPAGGRARRGRGRRARRPVPRDAVRGARAARAACRSTRARSSRPARAAR